MPEFATLGKVFRSTSPIELTESETEYVVSVVKHIMDNDHVILEFLITNTIADQLLVDARITLESTDDDNVYTIVQSISAAKLRCGIP